MRGFPPRKPPCRAGIARHPPQFVSMGPSPATINMKGRPASASNEEGPKEIGETLEFHTGSKPCCGHDEGSVTRYGERFAYGRARRLVAFEFFRQDAWGKVCDPVWRHDPGQCGQVVGVVGENVPCGTDGQAVQIETDAGARVLAPPGGIHGLNRA